MHPLQPDLSKITDTELSDKIGELNKKISIASRLGNGFLVQQLFMLLEGYQIEYRQRTEKQLNELLKQNGVEIKDTLDI